MRHYIKSVEDKFGRGSYSTACGLKDLFWYSTAYSLTCSLSFSDCEECLVASGMELLARLKQ